MKIGMKRAVFLDRDGTINVDKHYLYKKEDFEYLDGVVEALHILQDMHFLLIVVTNQSGIARGFYTEKDFYKLNAWMVSDIKNKGVKIEKVYYCPHYFDGEVKEYAIECNCRKPKTKLFWDAQREFEIDMSNSYVIGDKTRDISICNECDINGILIGNIIDKSTKALGNKENIWLCNTLLDAARLIRDMEYGNTAETSN